MILPVSSLGPDGVDLEGEDPVEAFDWVDSPREVVHPAGQLRWKLHAALFGRELVVTGRAEALFEGVCCRCGGPLSRVWGDSVALSRELPDEGKVRRELGHLLKSANPVNIPHPPFRERVGTDDPAALLPYLERTADAAETLLLADSQTST